MGASGCAEYSPRLSAIFAVIFGAAIHRWPESIRGAVGGLEAAK